MRRIVVTSLALISIVVLGTLAATRGPRSAVIEAAPTQNPQPVAVTNFPAVQGVTGTVNVANLPAVQNVAGTVAVANLPARAHHTDRLAGLRTGDDGRAAALHYGSERHRNGRDVDLPLELRPARIRGSAPTPVRCERVTCRLPDHAPTLSAWKPRLDFSPEGSLPHCTLDTGPDWPALEIG